MPNPGAQSSQPAFRSLEYWKPPKAVRHIRAKSSALFSLGPAGPVRHTFVNLEEGNSKMSFATLGEMAGRRKNNAYEDIQVADDFGQPRGAPTAYKIDRDDTLAPRWYDVRSWGWKKWAIAGATLVIVIIILVVVIVLVTKKDKYPNYSKINYKIVDTCKSSLPIALASY